MSTQRTVRHCWRAGCVQQIAYDGDDDFCSAECAAKHAERQQKLAMRGAREWALEYSEGRDTNTLSYRGDDPTGSKAHAEGVRRLTEDKYGRVVNIHGKAVREAIDYVCRRFGLVTFADPKNTTARLLEIEGEYLDANRDNWNDEEFEIERILRSAERKETRKSHKKGRVPNLVASYIRSAR